MTVLSRGFRWFLQTLKNPFQKVIFAPVYYFYGENTLLIDKAVEDIKAAFFSGQGPGLGLESFDGQSNSSSEIINSARTLPFGANKKLVIVKSAYSFKTGQTEKFGSYFSRSIKIYLSCFCCRENGF